VRCSRCIDRLAAEGRSRPRSGEPLFLVNNLLFVPLTFTVLVGTVFPLLVEAVRGVQMSVGRPYFDRMAVPLGVAVLLLMGVGPALPWGRATTEQVRKALLPPLVGALVFGGAGLALGVRRPWTLVALAFGGYTAQVTLRELWLPLSRRMRAHGESAGRAFVEAEWRRGRRRLGAYVVHAGAVLAIVAIAVSSTMGVSREVELRLGETTEVGAYTLTFLAVERESEPHREAVVARIAVARGGKDLGVLSPRMNQYRRQREPIGTPAVRTSLSEDLYLDDERGRRPGSLGLHAMVNPWWPGSGWPPPSWPWERSRPRPARRAPQAGWRSRPPCHERATR
jgi:cytochrome c-type biogenesis protein CcmF